MKSKNGLSKLAWIVCCLTIFCTGFFYYPKWKMGGTEATISWDVSGYYMYLPALFIYNDLRHCRFKDEVMTKYGPTPDFQQAYQHPSGNYVMKYSSGQAVLMSPFFFAGHLIAKAAGYDADGFSSPYQVSIGIGMMLYAFIGLWFLRKLLLQFFEDRIVAITLIALAIATNYLNYAAIDSAMTHNPLFTVYVLILYLTSSYYEFPGRTKLGTIGLLCGLASLTRPTEMISILIPLLWGVEWKDIRTRIRFISRHWKDWLLFFVCLIAVGSIQLIYWKQMTGSWLVYSYGDESFNFLRPHLKQCFIGFRSGWLVYSPIMILALIGFVQLYKRLPIFFLCLFSFFFLFTYVCFSWDTWWYGGSLGQRSMIQCYPVLSFPLASLLTSVSNHKAIIKWLTGAFVIFCILFNTWLTHQAHRGGLLRPGEMNGAYFRAIFGRSKVAPETEFLLDNPTQFKRSTERSTILLTQDFNSDSTAIHEDAISGKSILLDGARMYSPEYYFEIKDRSQKHLRTSADFKSWTKEWDVWKMPQMVVKFYKGEELVKTKYIRIFRVLGDHELKRFSIDVDISGIDFDRSSVLFYNPGSMQKLMIDNLEVIQF